jgi:hypothetical protein
LNDDIYTVSSLTVPVEEGEREEAKFALPPPPEN